MAQRLKRWESPRRRGRNDKGKGGAARRRQIKKQQKMLRRKLKLESSKQISNKKKNRRTREEGKLILFLSSFWTMESSQPSVKYLTREKLN